MGRGFLDVLSARDISIGGLGISVPHGFAGCDIDSDVDLIVTLGRTRPFKARGAIRHHGRPGSEHVFGVEFSGLSPEQQQAIEAYIRTCLRRRSRSSMASVAP
jgi:c-di-GMP-binding flagellar brake protein YcgR